MKTIVTAATAVVIGTPAFAQNGHASAQPHDYNTQSSAYVVVAPRASATTMPGRAGDPDPRVRLQLQIDQQ